MANNSPTVKQQIKRAFMRLLSEKPYAEITVTDIINKAEVARVSYYRNFKSFDKILESIVEDMADDYKNEILPLLNGDDERNWRMALRRLFERMLITKPEFTEMLHANMAVIFTRFGSLIDKIYSESEQGISKGKYYNVAKMGMIDAVSRHWIETGAKEPPEEMTDFLMGLLRKF